MQKSRFGLARRFVRIAIITAAALVATASVALSLDSAGTPATSTELDGPTAAVPIPASAGGGFLIADMRNNVVREVDANGNITTVAGDGTAGETGDNGPAVDAELGSPTDAVPLPGGGFLIADSGIFSGTGGTVREVSPSGIITTVAGQATNNGVCAGANSVGDGCPATQALLGFPTSAVPLAGGGFLIADEGDNDVREVDTNGIISTVAGEEGNTLCAGHTDSAGDGCPATQAVVDGPTAAIPFQIGGAAVSTPGSGFLITEEQGCAVRFVDSSGVISTVAGTGTCRGSDPAPPTSGTATSLELSVPTDARPTATSGVFLVADAGSCDVREVNVNTDTYTTLANDASCAANSGSGFGVTAAIPTVAGDPLVADASSAEIFQASSSGVLTPVAGTGKTGYNISPPAITGTPTPGQTLGCSQGTWSDSPTGYAYQWNSDGVAISSATAATYLVGAADVGHAVTCTVTASTGTASQTDSATSAPVSVTTTTGTTTTTATTTTATTTGTTTATATPLPSALSNVSAPAISGAALQGDTLTCSNGTWTTLPAAYARQWRRDGSAIAGATSATYKITPADAGHALTCTVVATVDGMTSSATSARSTVAAAPTCVVTKRSPTVLLTMPKSKRKPKPATDALTFSVRCDQPARLNAAGTIVETSKQKHHKAKSISLGSHSVAVKAGVPVAIVLKLPAAAIAGLQSHTKESATLTLVVTNVNGIGHTSAKALALKAKK